MVSYYIAKMQFFGSVWKRYISKNMFYMFLRFLNWSIDILSSFNEQIDLNSNEKQKDNQNQDGMILKHDDFQKVNTIVDQILKESTLDNIEEKTHELVKPEIKVMSQQKKKVFLHHLTILLLNIILHRPDEYGKNTTEKAKKARHIISHKIK